MEKMGLLFDQETEGCVQDSVRVFQWTEPGGRLSLELLEGFHDLSGEKREEHYPFDDRPEIILEDTANDVQLTLQFLDKELKPGETRTALLKISELTKNAYPRYQSSPEYLFEKGDILIGWFVLSMEDIEKEHVKAVFSIDHKMTLLTLTYPEKESFKWRPIFKYIFGSFKMPERRGESGNGTGLK